MTEEQMLRKIKITARKAKRKAPYVLAVEDLIQETYVVLLERSQTLGITMLEYVTQNPSAIYGIISHYVRDNHPLDRRYYKQVLAGDVNFKLEYLDPHHYSEVTYEEDIESLVYMEDILSELEEDDIIKLLLYLEGYTYQEIAETIGITRATVSKHIKQIANRLTQHEDS